MKVCSFSAEVDKKQFNLSKKFSNQEEAKK